MKTFMPRFICLLAAGAIAANGFLQLQRVQAAPPPPPPRERLEDTLADLNLTPGQQQKADAALADLQRKQRQLHEDFLHQLSDILTPEQLQKLEQSDRPSRPPGHNASHSPSTRPVVSQAAAKGTVIFTGGFETDPRDHGRPVVLIAAGLGVSTDVFRTAFSGVTPASAGEQPREVQVRLNKQALMKVLQPHGITDDKLNTVSNYYRYSASKGEMWKTKPATATAVITNGVVTAIKLTSAGAGYSSPPVVSVVGYDNVKTTVELSFGSDLATNGAIKSVAISLDQQ